MLSTHPVTFLVKYTPPPLPGHRPAVMYETEPEVFLDMPLNPRVQIVKNHGSQKMGALCILKFSWYFLPHITEKLVSGTHFFV